MQIAIDINDKIYKEILNGKDGWSNYVHGLIRTGTLLPKGHGRLIDVSKLKQDIFDDNSWRYKDYSPNEGYSYKQIKNAPVIIKADKEQEE